MIEGFLTLFGLISLVAWNRKLAANKAVRDYEVKRMRKEDPDYQKRLEKK